MGCCASTSASREAARSGRENSANQSFTISAKLGNGGKKSGSSSGPGSSYATDKVPQINCFDEITKPSAEQIGEWGGRAEVAHYCIHRG